MRVNGFVARPGTADNPGAGLVAGAGAAGEGVVAAGGGLVAACSSGGCAASAVSNGNRISRMVGVFTISLTG